MKIYENINKVELKGVSAGVAAHKASKNMTETVPCFRCLVCETGISFEEWSMGGGVCSRCRKMHVGSQIA